MNSIKVIIPTTTVLHIRQPCILPFLDFRPLRAEFPADAVSNSYKEKRNKWEAYPDFSQFLTWAKSAPNPIYELHVVATQAHRFKRSQELLADPKYKTALFFIGGRQFNKIVGHPDGTEIWSIDDVMYRTITWRSITTNYWNKRYTDAKITIKNVVKDDGFIDPTILFLYKCEKLNEEPIKSIINDAVASKILEADRPKTEAL